MQDLWTQVGKQTYLEKIHPLVIATLCNSHDKTSASIASVVLIGSSEELGVAITLHQVIWAFQVFLWLLDIITSRSSPNF